MRSTLKKHVCPRSGGPAVSPSPATVTACPPAVVSIFVSNIYVAKMR
jgi:hypothetical protein